MNIAYQLTLMMLCLSALLLPACASKPATPEPIEENLTVGTAQRKISLGMPSADVIVALGSPNVVSTDSDRREVWVYDKISTEAISSNVSAGIWLLTLGSTTGGGGGVNGGRSSYKSTQRTLTVIIKYDNDSRVRDFAYHTSRF
jgi:hypothetical protein